LETVRPTPSAGASAAAVQRSARPAKPSGASECVIFVWRRTDEFWRS
jgi:hypothetical protein